jgi:hypothetical protein
VGGITWDGHSVWISVAGQTNVIIIVDPTTGQTLRTMSSPTQIGPSDLDFDGTNVWVSSGQGNAFRLDATTGGVLQFFPTAGPDFGIALRSGEAWIGGRNGGLGVYSSSSGALFGRGVHDNGTDFAPEEVGPSCFVGEQLVIVSTIGIAYYDIISAL